MITQASWIFVIKNLDYLKLYKNLSPVFFLDLE